MDESILGLSGSKLHLREVSEGDLPIFFEQQLDPQATQMAAFPSRDKKDFMAHWAKILSDPSVQARAIVVDGRVAGHVLSFELLGEREVGYWLGKEYWGRGVATRALAEFLEQLLIRPLYAHVAKHNLASLKVLQKCGFAICGEDEFTSAAGEPIQEFILKLESRGQTEVRSLYQQLLAAWNQRDAAAFAALFALDSQVIGFDGSQMAGPADIRDTLEAIFTHHPTPTYVGKIRRVRFLTPGVAVLSAVAGVIPSGQTDLNPALNALQTLVASHDGQWKILLYQNTPAQFHGRPDLVQRLTDELRREISH